MAINIVVSDGMDEACFQKLKSHNSFNVYSEKKINPTTLDGLLNEVNGLVIRSATVVNKDLINKAPNLKYVIRAGEGTDNIDKSYCAEKGIKVSNTPGANNNSAAEHAIALMMSVLRHTPNADHSMKDGRWDKALYSGMELTNKKIGIIGFGRIGQIVAKRLSGFEPEILFYDPFMKDSPFDYAKREESLEKIFSESDIITLHTPLMEETKGMINKNLICLMKKSAIIVNASRGGIVDEDALYEALHLKNIKGAGFDVFKNEPIEKDHPFLKLSNMVLTPHLGASTNEAQERVGAMAVDQLIEFFDNNNLLNEVKA